MLDAFIKANISNRITFKTMDTKNSIIAIDSEGAELLNNGEALIRINSDLIKYKAYYIDESKLKELLEPYRKPKEVKAPELKPSPTIESNDIDLDFLDLL